MKVLVINGPNINLLGVREPELYGSGSFDNLVKFINESAASLGIEPMFFQSNCEGAIIDAIQNAMGDVDAIVINPAAYTHTSIAIADALKAVGLPAVEVHLTDIKTREPYRRISYTSEACIKTICGMGFDGYRLALITLLESVKQK
ncbi:MAG: type II 3-dehydroquinate dehydratase [Oscillospiraceae bacterium]|nr:type II 3-dehydroquinate dehydratase [Oscillospiraceae bacterium]